MMAVVADGGVSAIDTMVALGTVIFAVAETLPSIAVMVAVPGDTAVTIPALTVATLAASEVHVTVLVRSAVVLSEYVPVATNC